MRQAFRGSGLHLEIFLRETRENSNSEFIKGKKCVKTMKLIPWENKGIIDQSYISWSSSISHLEKTDRLFQNFQWCYVSKELYYCNICEFKMDWTKGNPTNLKVEIRGMKRILFSQPLDKRIDFHPLYDQKDEIVGT